MLVTVEIGYHSDLVMSPGMGELTSCGQLDIVREIPTETTKRHTMRLRTAPVGRAPRNIVPAWFSPAQNDDVEMKPIALLAECMYFLS